MNDSILHCCCEGAYIPPCQRKPYYDDPRDVQPTSEEWAANLAKAMIDYASYPLHQYSNEVFQCGCDVSSQPDKSVEIDMIQCLQCGTYFPKRIFSPFSTNVCDECLRKSQEEFRNSQD